MAEGGSGFHNTVSHDGPFRLLVAKEENKIMNGLGSTLAVVQTPGFAHYALAWSPFHPTRLALASSANFGLVGNGRLHLTTVGPGLGNGSGVIIDKLCVIKKKNHSVVGIHKHCTNSYETQDGLYDVAWSEIHENQLVTGSGDGSIRLWDVTLKVFQESNIAYGG